MSWALLGALGALLWRSWPLLGRSWGALGRSWDALGMFLDRFFLNLWLSCVSGALSDQKNNLGLFLIDFLSIFSVVSGAAWPS